VSENAKRGPRVVQVRTALVQQGRHPCVALVPGHERAQLLRGRVDREHDAERVANAELLPQGQRFESLGESLDPFLLRGGVVAHLVHGTEDRLGLQYLPVRVGPPDIDAKSAGREGLHEPTEHETRVGLVEVVHLAPEDAECLSERANRSTSAHQEPDDRGIHRAGVRVGEQPVDVGGIVVRNRDLLAAADQRGRADERRHRHPPQGGRVSCAHDQNSTLKLSQNERADGYAASSRLRWIASGTLPAPKFCASGSPPRKSVHQ
jgi:hypothetical protein